MTRLTLFLSNLTLSTLIALSLTGLAQAQLDPGSVKVGMPIGPQSNAIGATLSQGPKTMPVNTLPALHHHAGPEPLNIQNTMPRTPPASQRLGANSTSPMNGSPPQHAGGNIRPGSTAPVNTPDSSQNVLNHAESQSNPVVIDGHETIAP